MRRPTAAPLESALLFGQTSLFVYWVHVEIAYGVFSYPIQHLLPLPWSLAAFVALTLLMLGAAVLWSRRGRGDWIPRHLVAPVKLEVLTSNLTKVYRLSIPASIRSSPRG